MLTPLNKRAKSCLASKYPVRHIPGSYFPRGRALNVLGMYFGSASEKKPNFVGAWLLPCSEVFVWVSEVSIGIFSISRWGVGNVSMRARYHAFISTMEVIGLLILRDVAVKQSSLNLGCEAAGSSAVLVVTCNSGEIMTTSPDLILTILTPGRTR